MKLFDSLKDEYLRNKEQKDIERSYIKTHKGTVAICAYMKSLFDKEQAGYRWLIKEKTPLFLKIYDNRVALCYTGIEGAEKGLKGSIPKNIEAACYSFRKMYAWYGLRNEEGYQILKNKTQRDALCDCIIEQVKTLPHIKYQGGFLVKSIR